MFEKFVKVSVNGKAPHEGRANGCFLIEAGGVSLKFVGGPFRHADQYANSWKLKMAKEQPGQSDYIVPLVDFTAPTTKQLIDAAERAITAAMTGRTVYVGCAGGIGRTGTMMAAILKVFFPDADPVKIVRAEYLGHAVETGEQMRVLDQLDVTDLRKKVLRRLFWLGLGNKLRRFFGG